MAKVDRDRAARAMLLAGMGLATLLAGCSGLGVGEKEYGCKGRPDGVRCLSARDAYHATETRDRLGPTDAAGAPAAGAGQPAPVTEAAPATDAAPGAGTAAPSQPPLPAVDGPVPLRTPSRVMRIRMNYWEDEAGDLHVPGYIYTEIEPRRWQVGVPAAVADPVLRRPKPSQPSRHRASKAESPRESGDGGLQPPAGRP